MRKQLKTQPFKTEAHREKPKKRAISLKKSSSNSRNSSFREGSRDKTRETGLKTKKIPKYDTKTPQISKPSRDLPRNSSNFTGNSSKPLKKREKSSKISLISLDSDEESAQFVVKKPSLKRNREISRDSSPSFSESVENFKEGRKKLCKTPGNRENLFENVQESAQIKGNFFKGDKAKSIKSAKVDNDEIICQIEWFPRKNGMIPENSSFTNTIIKEFDPLLLVNYYEKGIVKLKKSKFFMIFKGFLRNLEENSQEIEKKTESTGGIREDGERNGENSNKKHYFAEDFKSPFIEERENLIKTQEIIERNKENSSIELSQHENNEEKQRKIKLDELLSNISAKNN